MTDSADGPHVPGHGPSPRHCLLEMPPEPRTDQDSNLAADRIHEKAHGSQQSWGQLSSRAKPDREQMSGKPGALLFSCNLTAPLL